MKIKGQYNEAKIFTDNMEETAIEQIKNLLNHPAFSDTKIRIMPDVHAGAGCVIGFTSTLKNRVVPNLIGVDIGCGVRAVNIGKVNIDFADLDRFIKEKIPFGRKRNKHKDTIPEELEKRICEVSRKIGINPEEQLKGAGSLGGGNHFIEVNQSKTGDMYITIHSGSRNFGKQVCDYHQKKAVAYCEKKKKEITGRLNAETGKLKKEGLEKQIGAVYEKYREEIKIYTVEKKVAFLEGEDAEEYIEDLKTAQEYADINRKIMLERIRAFLGAEVKEIVNSVHNYIDFSSTIPIARKGAISSKEGELVIIPLNMRDGVIVGRGKGNDEWNNSAPHGAGRTMSRTKAKEGISMADFRETMKNVWSSCINKDTLDESPFAYKPAEEILNSIGETIEIIDVIKPVYNFKAAE